MKVRTKVRPSGLINGAEWPPEGSEIDLADVVAQTMLDAGLVELAPVDVELVDTPLEPPVVPPVVDPPGETTTPPADDAQTATAPTGEVETATPPTGDTETSTPPADDVETATPSTGDVETATPRSTRTKRG